MRYKKCNVVYILENEKRNKEDIVLLTKSVFFEKCRGSVKKL